nr:bone morphogenetic protein 10 [Sinonovacula constricta]
MQHMFLVLGLSLCSFLPVLCHPLVSVSSNGLTLGNAGHLKMEGTHAEARDVILSMDGSHDISDLDEDGNNPEEDRYSSRRHLDQTSVENAVSQTPEYMLELYNNLSKNKPNLHNSNTIRSFKVIPLEQRQKAARDIMGEFGYRIHNLQFDISALDASEKINSAELRLFTLIKKDQKSFGGVSRLVSVFQVKSTASHDSREYITSKFVHSAENAWESFDVTKALQNSMNTPHRHNAMEKLEVRIQSLFTSASPDNMDITINPNDTRQPLLVVYSNDNSPVHEEEVDRHELLIHELATNVGANSKMVTYNDDEDDELTSHKRSKRSRGYVRNSSCRLRPLYVNFADIGHDSWIIAPRAYPANQCAGRCNFPFTASMAPSSHAIIQYAMKQRFPRRVSKVCCVPTKLESISMLYYERGVYIYKAKYEGMVVTECGCR